MGEKITDKNFIHSIFAVTDNIPYSAGSCKLPRRNCHVIVHGLVSGESDRPIFTEYDKDNNPVRVTEEATGIYEDSAQAVESVVIFIPVILIWLKILQGRCCFHMLSPLLPCERL